MGCTLRSLRRSSSAVQAIHAAVQAIDRGFNIWYPLKQGWAPLVKPTLETFGGHTPACEIL